MTEIRADPLGERVSSLEQSVKSLHDELSDIRTAMSAGFLEIQTQLRGLGKPNWSVLLAAAGLAGALYAAAVAPVKSNVARLEAEVMALETVDTERLGTLSDLRIQLAITEARLQDLETRSRDVYLNGSPITDKRLALLEAAR